MENERSRLLNLLFSDGYPSQWDYSTTFNDYLSKVGNYKVDDLLREPGRLREEKSLVSEQTQELAVTNYKTFIQTAECSRELFKQFNVIEGKLDELLDNLPKFESKCQKFADESSGINSLRRLNSLTLTRNAQLLEILELPQLMDSFINDGLYEDALELASYVRRLLAKHPDIPIFKSIVNDVEKSWRVMLHRLLTQLRQDLSLPKCLQIVGLLRRMEVFNEAELRLKFLQARNTWLQECLKGIAREDVNQHLNKTIEVTRVNLFTIVTQYRAIFNDDEHSPLVAVKTQQVNQNVIFYSWINDRIKDFLKTLENDLNGGITSVDSILGQCMYFGLSFSRVGCDFRALMIPIFTRKIVRNFQESVAKASRNIEKNMERFTLINKNHPNVPWKSKSNDPLQPPESLLEFYPLAEYLNNILCTFNELRLCSPIAIIANIVEILQNSLSLISRLILVLYGQEHQAFTANSKDAFTRLCLCFADDLVPYLQKCIHVIYPPSAIASHVGVNVQTLQNESISFLDRNVIIEPIEHLLPVKIEPVVNAVEKYSDTEEKNDVTVESDNNKVEM